MRENTSLADTIPFLRMKHLKQHMPQPTCDKILEQIDEDTMMPITRHFIHNDSGDIRVFAVYNDEGAELQMEMPATDFNRLPRVLP